VKTNPSLFFDLLKGRWYIARTLTPGGVFKGDAFFNEVNAGVLTYEEQGTLILDDGTILNPSKRYQWREEEGNIALYFDDGVTKGTRFHTLNFIDKNRAEAEHLCGEDFYQSEYQFNFPDTFTVIHTVKGPSKNYVSLSQFTRNSC